jgi:hypothetical protein
MDSQQVIHVSGDRVVRGCLVEGCPCKDAGSSPGGDRVLRDLGPGAWRDRRSRRGPEAGWRISTLLPRPSDRSQTADRTPPDDRLASDN